MWPWGERGGLAGHAHGSRQAAGGTGSQGRRNANGAQPGGRSRHGNRPAVRSSRKARSERSGAEASDRASA